MEGQDTEVIPYVQFSVDSIHVSDTTTPSSSQKDVTTEEISFCLDDAVVLDSVLPLFDSDQIIFGELLDQDTLLDGVQLATLVIDEPFTDSGENITDSVSNNTQVVTESLPENNTGNLIGSLIEDSLSELVETLNQADDQSSVSYEPPSIQPISVSPSPDGEQSSKASGISNETLTATSAEGLHSRRGTSFVCSACNKSFSKWFQFKRHRRKHLNDKPWKCGDCGKTFNLEANLKLHVMLHEAEISGSITCQICSAKFSRIVSLKSHLRIHEKDEMCVCEQCGLEFPTMTLLETHQAKHKPKANHFNCKFCYKTFTKEHLFKKHTKVHDAVRKHLNTLKNIQVKKPNFKKTGGACRNDAPKFSQGIYNTSPFQSSKIETPKSRSCTVCGKVFPKPSQLRRHVLIHTGERPYKCTYCDKTFNQKATRDKHVSAMHEMVRPYACNVCSSSFASRSNLKSHVMKVHSNDDDDKPLKCPECPSIFRTLAVLNNHISRMHTVKKALVVECRELSANLTEISSTVRRPETVPIVLPLENANDDLNEENVTFPNSSESASENTVVNSVNSDFTAPLEFKVDSVSGSISEVKYRQREATDVSKMNVHKESACKDRWHLCPHCPKSFLKPSDLIRHTRTHTLDRPFKCTQCPKAFAVKSTLKTHIMLVHSRSSSEIEKKLKCKICHKECQNIPALKSHQLTHITKKIYKCSYEGCEKSFKTISHRLSHMRIHTGKVQKRLERPSQIVNPVKPNPLPAALKITKEGVIPVPNRMDSLSTDTQSFDARTRRHRCTYCPSAFKRSSHLQQHIMTHTGERPYECSECDRRFTSATVLDIHMKSHQGIRSYKCDVCGLGLTTRSSLRRHKALHTQGRHFMCPVCKRTFKTNVYCRKHIKLHLHDSESNIGEGTVPESSAKSVDLPNVNSSPLTIQVSTSNTNTVVPPPVTVSKVTVPVTVVQSNESVNRLSLDTGTSKPNIIYVGRVEDVIQHQANGNLQSAQYIIQDTLPFENIVLPSSSSSLISVNPASQLVYNVAVSNSYKPPSTSVVTSLVPQPHSFQEKSNPTVIEIDSSQVKSALADRVAVTKLGPTNNSTIVHAGIPTLNITCTPTTSCSNASFIPLQHTVHPTVVRFEESCPNVCGQPIILKTESITIEDLASRNSNSTNSSKPPLMATVEVHSKPPILPTIQVTQTATDEPAVNQNEEIETENTSEEKFRKKTYVVNECSDCNRTFKRHSDLIRHIRIHTGERPFKCNVCNEAFRVKSTRDSHLRIHDKGKTVTCGICYNMFANRSSLKVHMRLHTGARPYICLQCGKNFRTTGHLQAHGKTHFKNPNKNRLNKTGQYYQNVTEHNVAASPGFPDLPLLSQMSYNTKDIMVSATIPEENPVMNDTTTTFPVVNQPASSADSNTIDLLQLLGNVIQLPNDSLQNIQISSLEANSLMGEDILQSFIFVTPNDHQESISGGDPQSNSMATIGNTNDESLFVHGTSQTNLAEFANINTDMELQLDNCAIANKNAQVESGIASDSILSRDLKMFHGAINGSDPFLTSASDQNPLLQTSCGKKSEVSGKNGLKSSAPVQNNGNPKQCPDCGKTFSRPSQMVRHRRTHTGEKPEVCNICHRNFSQKSSLTTHMMFTHSDIRRFKCSECPFQTVQKAALKKHFTRAHPDVEWSEASGSVSSSNDVNHSASGSSNRSNASISARQINITTGSNKKDR